MPRRLYRRALAINEKALGQDHPDTAAAVAGLAIAHRSQGKYADAEELYKRAVAIKEKALGADHPKLADTLVALALVHYDQGRYADSEELNKRALIIREKTLGASHPDVANTLVNLALVYMEQGKYADAERLHQRALAIQEKALGANHSAVAASLDNLAIVYGRLEKYGEEEGLRRRALAISEKALGEDHPQVARNVNNLAAVYRRQGNYAAAEELLTRALQIKEKTVGGNHQSVAVSLHGIAGLYADQGKYAEAQEILERVLAIREKALGLDHPDVAKTVHGLANQYANQGKLAEAARLQKRALGIYEKAFGASHPDVAATLVDLAKVEADAHDIRSALDHFRKATAAVIAHAAAEAPGDARKIRGERSPRAALRLFPSSHRLSRRGRVEGIEPLPAAAREAFEIAQWASHSSAAAALQQMGLRFAAGSDALAALVRERQDLAAFWRDRDKALVAALSTAGRAAEPRCDRRIARARSPRPRRSSPPVATRLQQEFPDYAALASPKPLKAEEVQRLLGADEALVFWLAGEQGKLRLCADARWLRVEDDPARAEALAEKVAAFRRGLDVDAVARGLQRTECTQAEADKRGLSRMECGRVLAKECEEAKSRGLVRAECSLGPSGTRELFDLGLAHELYAALIGPVEALIKDKRHLLVVPSGALTALPFHLLVTEKPAVAVPQVNDAARSRRLSRRRLAAQAPCRDRAALGREPQGAAGVRAQGPGSEAADRVRRSGLRD